MPDLHAPTLRRVIEMLDGEIAEVERAQERDGDLGLLYVRERERALRAFRERLDREAEKVGG